MTKSHRKPNYYKTTLILSMLLAAVLAFVGMSVSLRHTTEKAVESTEKATNSEEYYFGEYSGSKDAEYNYKLIFSTETIKFSESDKYYVMYLNINELKTYETDGKKYIHQQIDDLDMRIEDGILWLKTDDITLVTSNFTLTNTNW